MKKIIFLFLILFISILTINAKSTFYLGEKVTDMYIESINGSEIHNGAPFLLHRGDGSIVYCINPFKMMSTTDTYKSYTYNDSIFNLTDEQLNKLNIIAYFGYGYQNHTDIKWYGITQFLIYKTLGLEDVYFTDAYYGSRIEKYVDEVNELEQLVNNYYKLPIFSNNNYEYDPNTSYKLIDTNNVLSNYEIKESNIESSISGNKLIINTGSVGSYNITFVKKSPITRDYILYSLDGAQSLIYPGKINDITFDVSIEVDGGSITINKYDCENRERLEATLTESIFGIYKDNVLVNKITVNNTVSMNNMALGNYTIKELTASKGYNIDPNSYEVTLSKDNKDIVINSCSKIIEGNLIINKYFGGENNYKLDESAVFEVYNNNQLIKTLCVDNSVIDEKLEYGTYLIKQVSGRKYYDLVDDFSVSILEEKDYVYNLYTDKTDEVKAYEELLDKREESLNKKEQELNELENKIEKEKNVLEELKDEISRKEEKLDSEREELNKIKEEIKEKEDDLMKLEKEINEEKENLSTDSILLDEKKKELNKLKEELNLLNSKLEEKEKKLIELENNINTKEKELNKKEEELIKLENKIEEENDVLVVEVPNTYKKSYNKIISIILMIVGSIFIIYSTKKVTGH